MDWIDFRIPIGFQSTAEITYNKNVYNNVVWFMHITGLHIKIGLQGSIIHASRAKAHLPKTVFSLS